MSLPENVIRRDQELDKAERTAGAELAKLRWRWTLDDTNPERVEFAEYAAQAGVSRQVIRVYAQGHANFAKLSLSKPDATIGDAIKLAEMGELQAIATAAIATAEGLSVSRAKDARKDEIKRLKASLTEYREEHPEANHEDIQHHANRMAKNAVTLRNQRVKQEKFVNDSVLSLYSNLTGDLAKVREGLQGYRNRRLEGDMSILPGESADYISRKFNEIVELVSEIAQMENQNLDVELEKILKGNG